MYDQQSAQELKYLCAHTTSQIECGKNVAHMCKEVFVYVQIVEEGNQRQSKQGCGLGRWNLHPALTRDKVSALTHIIHCFQEDPDAFQKLF